MIAEGLAQKYETTAREIYDYASYQGRIGYMKAGFASVRKETSTINYVLPEGYPVVVVFPIWAGSFPPAVRSFINQIGRENLILVPTSLSSKLKDREGFKGIIDLVKRKVDA